MKLQKAFFIIFIMVISATLLATLACVQEGEVYQKVDALLTKMTLEEKIGQMTQYSTAGSMRNGRNGSEKEKSAHSSMSTELSRQTKFKRLPWKNPGSVFRSFSG